MSPTVLLDGYNLALRQGTGIKTYGLLMEAALQRLGCSTEVLFGKAIPKSNDELLREVTFFDASSSNSTRLGRVFQKLGILGSALFGGSPSVQSIQQTGAVVLPAGEQLRSRIWNASNLFEVANQRHLRTGSFTSARMPNPVDVFHMTYPVPVDVKGARSMVVTIHDLIPLRLPYTTLDNKVELLRRHRKVAAQADLIFTVSEASKRDIVELLGIDPDKIAITRQPSRFAPLTAPERREQGRILGRFGLSAGAYILFVGAIEPKKNLGRLLRAYLEADLDVPLVIAGPRAWMADEEIGWFAAQDPRIARKVRLLGHVSVSDLRFLYSGASALTFPSLYEGYGLPLVEAMTFGLPILTARSSSLPEVCGDAALYCDPFDVRDIRDKLVRLMTDADARTWLSERALERSREITMETFTEEVRAGYAKLGVLN